MKAISLLSGGLDSILATKLILEQNINVEAVYFHNPFCDCESPGSSCKAAEKTAKLLKIPFHRIELGEEYLEIIKDPRHGYGKNINPCIDCRILQFKTAKTLMKKLGASFVVTGEVLNERPMSQRGPVMDMMDKEAGLQGLILRPLSAKKLKETQPEKDNIVDRSRFLDIQGRSRKIQIELAKKFNIEEYPTPSGGCLLTYEGYSHKVRDLIKHGQMTLDDVRLLKIGRHFRLGPKTKFIVGKDERENERLLSTEDKEALFFKAKDFPGPIGLLLHGQSDDVISTAASILAYYINKADNETPLAIEYHKPKDKQARLIPSKKATAAIIEQLRVTQKN